MQKVSVTATKSTLSPDSGEQSVPCEATHPKIVVAVRVAATRRRNCSYVSNVLVKRWGLLDCTDYVCAGRVTTEGKVRLRCVVMWCAAPTDLAPRG